MQPALFVKVLPRVAQVEAHGRDVGAARRGVGGFVREPFCPQRGCLVPVRGVGPLPGGLPVCLRQAPGRAQVVGVDGIQAVVDLCGHGDRPLGCGQVQVLALPCALCAAHAVFAQQAAFFVVHIGPAQVFGFALGGVPEAGEEVAQGLQQAGVFFLVVQGAVLAAGCGVQGFGLEHALAQGVVGVAGGGGVRALACLAALQAALAVVVVVVQAVGLQIACGVVLVGDAGAGAARAAGAGLAEAQEFVVAAFCAVAAGGGGACAFALAAGEVAVGVVLVGGAVLCIAAGAGLGEGAQAPGAVVAGAPGGGALGEGAVAAVGVCGLPEVLREALDAPCAVVLLAGGFRLGGLACAVVAAAAGQANGCAGQGPLPALGLAQGRPGDVLHDGLACPDQCCDLAGSVALVLQGLPAGVGGGAEQAAGVVLVADAAGVAVAQGLGFAGGAAQAVALVAGGAAGVGD